MSKLIVIRMPCSLLISRFGFRLSACRWFSEIAFHKLIEKPGGLPEPRLVVYAIGNPLYAQPILQNNRFAAYSIPFRLLIAEKHDRNGTIVTYHLPSSIMGHPDGANTLIVKRQTKILDERITRLVRKIVSVSLILCVIHGANA